MFSAQNGWRGHHPSYVKSLTNNLLCQRQLTRDVVIFHFISYVYSMFYRTNFSVYQRGGVEVSYSGGGVGMAVAARGGAEEVVAEKTTAEMAAARHRHTAYRTNDN